MVFDDLIIIFGGLLFVFGPIFVVYVTATGPSSKHERKSVGGIVPDQSKPEPCHLTQQIHEAAKEAGLCLECGSPLKYSGPENDWCECIKSGISELLRLDQKADWMLNRMIEAQSSKRDS